MTTQTQLKKQLINQIKNCWHPQEIGARCFCREISCSYPNCQARSLTLKTIDQHFQKKHSPKTMLNNRNNSQLFQYSQQNYTCDKCQQDFQKTMAYSPASDKQELAQHPTYCSTCVKPSLLVPISKTSNPKKKPKSKKNTVAYYQCLSACCQQGISSKTITQVAQECKHNSFGILAQRTNEIQKLNQAYQQIGVSLTSLLQPIKEE